MWIYTIVAFSSIQLIFGQHRSSDQCLARQANCFYQTAFPSLDGTCNNLNNPAWGASNTVLNRLLPPQYADSRGQPKSQGVFRNLTSTRSISNGLVESKKLTSKSVSHMHVLYGQLLAHDFVLTPLVKSNDDTALECDCDKPVSDCINIKIPPSDIQSQKANRKCMPLARSRAASGINGCVFPRREQINELSSYIDGTFIYGSSDRIAKELRDPRSNAGELATELNPIGGPHRNLPNQDQLKNKEISKVVQCPIKVHTPKNTPCFVAGDVRANENPGLTSLITIMVRYHNYVARNLKSINKAWPSDKVFNVARRIVSAIYQSITYREFIPPLLGPLWSKRFDLKLADGYAYWNGYDPRYNSGITNEFATAAFRYGHSQVTDTLTRRDSFFNPGIIANVPSKGTFFTSDSLLEKDGGGSGAFMRGFMVDDAEKTDTSVDDSLRNHLSRKIGEKFGGDLFAINVQRGRDHGLPGYNEYRELCGLTKAKVFGDFSNEIPTDIINRLRLVYDSVNDIDLYVGGLAENLVDGGEVGPTFACILAYGFRALRKGDRFWHENERSPSSFTTKQLSSIRKTTLASILCKVSEDMKFVLKSPLKVSNANYDRFVSCGSVYDLDFYAWKDDHQTNKYSRKSHANSEWTTWFITKYTNNRFVDWRQAASQISKSRPGGICENRLGFETRTVPKSSFIQIRFTCPAGSIRSSDFPFQLSQNYYWSQWIPARDNSVEIYEFKCKTIVAIQAKSGDKFAGETGDVFEKFGTEAGFLCRDNDQYNGKCQKYQVRALCLRNIKMRQEHFQEQFTTKQSVTLYPESIMPTKHLYPKPTTTAVPKKALDRTNSYCVAYNVCCIPPRRHNLKYSSNRVLTYAANLCKYYGICCNP
ncbi:myeloperoxidase-like [Styela clava]